MNATPAPRIRKCLSMLVMCASAAVLSACQDKISDADIQTVTLAETKALIQDKPGAAKAIDTRTPQEFAAGHLPGALNLDLAQVSLDKDSIDPALARFKTLVVYGEDAGSGSARAMTKRLMRAGHKGVKLFSGGMVEWLAAGLKVDKVDKAGTVPVK